MINSTDTDNAALIVAEINLLQTEKFVVLEINRGLSPVLPRKQDNLLVVKGGSQTWRLGSSPKPSPRRHEEKQKRLMVFWYSNKTVDTSKKYQKPTNERPDFNVFCFSTNLAIPPDK